MTKWFVDPSGNYIGGFDGYPPPVGSVEVPSPPDDGRQKWVNNAWQAYTPDYSTIDSTALNAALVEPGSVVRALGLVMFQEINKLRVLAGQLVYTMAQFIAALKANMR